MMSFNAPHRLACHPPRTLLRRQSRTIPCWCWLKPPTISALRETFRACSPRAFRSHSNNLDLADPSSPDRRRRSPASHRDAVVAGPSTSSANRSNPGCSDRCCRECATRIRLQSPRLRWHAAKPFQMLFRPAYRASWFEHYPPISRGAHPSRATTFHTGAPAFGFLLLVEHRNSVLRTRASRYPGPPVSGAHQATGSIPNLNFPPIRTAA